MTGAEQVTVNEIGRRVDALTETVSKGFEKIDNRLQKLEDDKVARDAVARARHNSVSVSWRAISTAFVVGLGVAGLVMRLLGY